MRDSKQLSHTKVPDKDSWLTLFSTKCFFMFYIVVTVFILLNTVMAILVEKTFSLTKQDEEAQARAAETEKEEELQVRILMICLML